MPIPTLLPLETFRKIMGYNPWHFWGLYNSNLAPITDACNTIVTEYSWQSVDAAGRNEIRQAIQMAESQAHPVLGYPIYPSYYSDTLPWPRYRDRLQARYGYAGATGRRLPIRVQYGYVFGAGIERITSLGEAVVAYTDGDGDGLKETFTASVATGETDPNNLVAYFISTDRGGDVMCEDWRIRPVRITITGGIATVTGKSWLVVVPSKYEGVTATQPLDILTASNFVAKIEIATRKLDPTGNTTDVSQARMEWNTFPEDTCSGCITPSYSAAHDPAAEGYAVARCGLLSGKNGLLLPAEAVYNNTTGLWCDVGYATFPEPDRVTIRYKAGFPVNRQGEVSDTLATAIARFSAAELGRRICACDQASQELYHWQFDLSRSQGANDEQYSISFDDLANLFGTRRGHLFAWKAFRNLRLMRGLILS